MAIRIRTVSDVRVALCAAETGPVPGDVYLDDADHYALAAKFRLDWKDEQTTGWPEYPVEWAAMATQKLRDAKEELLKCLAASDHVAAALPQGAVTATTFKPCEKHPERYCNCEGYYPACREADQPS